MFQKFHSIRECWNGQVQKISIIATDLLMHISRLPEDTITDYAFIQQFFASMNPRLLQEVETQYTGDEDINTLSIGVQDRMARNAMIHNLRNPPTKKQNTNKRRSSITMATAPK